MEANGTPAVETVQALRKGPATGSIADLAAPLSMEQLLDLYQEALLGGEQELANRLRLLVRGRLHEIETFSFGSSLVRQLMHGRKAPIAQAFDNCP